MAKAELVSKLTPADRKALAKHEETIRNGLASFIEVGQSLIEIRDSELYREDFGTFEEYCQTQWDLPRQRAYDKIAAAEVIAQLSNVRNSGQIPLAESQALELAKAKKDAPKVWAEVLKRSPKLADGSPCTTAKKIAAIRDELLNPKPKEQPKQPVAVSPGPAADQLTPPAAPSKESQSKAEDDAKEETSSSATSTPEDEATKILRSLDARLLAKEREIKAMAEELGKFSMTSKYPKLRTATGLVGSLETAARSCRAVAAACRDAVSVGECTGCKGKGGACKDCSGDGFMSYEEQRNAHNRRMANVPRAAV